MYYFTRTTRPRSPRSRVRRIPTLGHHLPNSSDSRRGPTPPRSPSPPPPPPPPPELVDDVICEVLLRLPPDNAAILAGAALVCKSWRRIVSDPTFHRRLRELHRAHPPMLGFVLYNLSCASTFIPTSSLYLHHAEERREWRVLDARHGRVLLHGMPKDAWTNPMESGLFVWDLVTDHTTALPLPPRKAYAGTLRSWNATVVCAGACDRCRPGCDGRDNKHFVVVVVGSCVPVQKYSCVYSSEDGEWRNRSYNPRGVLGARCHVEMAMPTALVGRSLYFSDQTSRVTLSFNLDTRGLCVLPLPPDCLGERTVFMATDGGERLGLAAVKGGSNLVLWSGVASSDGGGMVGVRWGLSRVIELEELLPASAAVAGVADDVGVIFLRTADHGIFTLDLNSGRVEKV